MFSRIKNLAYVAVFAACAGCASTERAEMGAAGDHAEQAEQVEQQDAQTEDAEGVREVAGDEAAERVEELVRLLNSGRVYEVRKRLDLRLELARLDSSQPHTSAEKLWYELSTLAGQLAREQRWEELLAVSQTLVATREMESSNATDPTVKRWVRDATPVALHGLALWKTGRKERGLEYLHAYIRHVEGFDNLAGLNHLLYYVVQSDEHALAADLIEHALGAASFSAEPNRMLLTARMGGQLLSSAHPEDRAEGEALLHYCLLVAEGREDMSSLYATVSQAAARHGLAELQEMVSQRRLEAGYISHFEVETMAAKLLQNGELDELEVLAERFTQSREDPVFLEKVSRWFAGAGDSRRAYEYLERALESRPDGYDWWRRLAQLGFEIGEDEAALEALEHFLEKGGGAAWQVQTAAQILQQANREADALDLLERVAHENPGNISLISQIVYTLRSGPHRDRIAPMLLAIADDEDLPSHSVFQLAQLIEGEAGADEAAPVYLRAAEAGNEEAVIRVIGLALNGQGDKGLAEVLDQLEPFEALSFNSQARLWYQIQHRLDREVRVAFLEKLIANAPVDQAQYYRVQLTDIYMRSGEISAVIEIWDEPGPVQFQQIHLGQVDPGTRRDLLDEFEARYPDGQAPAGMLFFAAEQYWSLWQAGGASAVEADQGEDEHRSAAHRLYLAAVETADEGSDLAGAMRLFESRRLYDVAEAVIHRRVRDPNAEPAVWFDYGRFLIRRGRFAAAEHVFQRYINEHHDSLQSANDYIFATIAANFRAAGQPARAERFYRMALVSAERTGMSTQRARNLVASSGQGLGNLLLEEGRVDEFLELTSDFEEKYRGEHPFLQPHERAVDLVGLREHGLWEHYVERMDRLSDLENISESSHYARALWNAGRRDDAWEAFEEQVEQSHSKSAQWLQVAGFMETRGAGDYAALAYDRAVRTAEPRHNRPAALIGRAQYLAWQGHFEAAVADYNAVAESVYGPQYAFQTMVSAFSQVGRQELAVEAARAAQSPFKHLASPTLDAAALELPTDELAERVTTMNAGGSAYEATRMLGEHGRADVLDSLIRQQLANGDRAAALQLLSTSREALVEADLLEPLVSEMVSKTVGSDEYQLELLRLGQHLQQGDYERAIDTFERWGNQASQGQLISLHLAANPETLDGAMLSRQLRFAPSPVELSIDFHRFARPDEFSEVLRQSAEANVPLNKAVELHLSELFRRGGSMAVFSLLRRKAEEMVRDGELVAGRPSSSQLLATRAEFVRALALVAAHGYAQEVAALVEELPKPLRSSPELETFSGALSEFAQTGEAGAPEASQKPAESLLELRARTLGLIGRGHLDAAEQLLLDAFERRSLTGGSSAAANIHRSRSSYVQQGYYAQQGYHQPTGDEANAEQVLGLLLSVYLAKGEPDGADRVIGLWKERMSHTDHRSLRLVGMLEQYGFLEQAARVAAELAERSPTSQVLDKALTVAAKSTDHELFEKIFSAYWRQQGIGSVLGQAGFRSLVRRSDADTAGRLLERVLSARPASVDTRIAQILVAFDAGRVDEGRAHLRQFARDFRDSEEALETLTRQLGAAGYDVELARVFLPEVDADELSEESLVHLGYAHLELGLDDEAASHFVGAIERRSNAELSAARLVRKLAIDGYAGAARALAEAYLEQNPRLRLAFLARGLARLADADERAEADLERGLEGRRADLDALRDVSLVALRAGQDGLAERYLGRMLRLPDQVGPGRAHPLRVAIGVFIEAERAGWGVEFLDRHVPTLLEEPFLVISPEWTLAIGEAFAAAGLGERAEAWYARSLRYFSLSDPQNTHAASLLEARAYNLLINGDDPERAAELSRSAAAIAGASDGTILAMIALSQHKAGDSVQARETLERAVLVGFPRPTYPLVLDDLEAAIRQARIGSRPPSSQPRYSLPNLLHLSHPPHHSFPQPSSNHPGRGGGGLIRGGHIQGIQPGWMQHP